MTASTATTARATAAAERAAILREIPAEGRRLVTTAEFVEWANANGFEVKSGRGRKPLAAVDKFNLTNRHKQYVLDSRQQAQVTYEYVTANGRAGKFRAQPQQVRAWARANGHAVGERGRFSQALRDAYGQAQAAARKS